MMARAVFGIGFAAFVFLGAGCSPDTSATERQALAAESATLLRERDSSIIVAPRWPQAIAALHPTRVYRTRDGLYIVTAERSVVESGFFIPRDPGFAPSVATDPSYEPAGQGVYRYRVKG